MFERFTDRARRVVVLAQEEARMLEHNYIGTEHLLLALIREGEGVAAAALRALEVDLDTLRREVEALVGRGQQPAKGGHIPFTPRAKKALELSLRESVQLGHAYIGTEHLLLGIVREGEGPAAQVLQQRGLELNTVRQEVIRLLHGYQGRPGRRRRVVRTRLAGAEFAGGGTLEDIARQLRVLSTRLTAIEEKLGVEDSPARQRLRRVDAEIARVRRQKESAIDEQDFERAAGLRDEERRLLADRRVAEDEWLVAGRVHDQEGAAAPGDVAPDDLADGRADGGPDEPGDEAPGAASGQ
jgi:ATP-dependent Clp protease ATP-binding subunit ClpA